MLLSQSTYLIAMVEGVRLSIYDGLGLGLISDPLGTIIIPDTWVRLCLRKIFQLDIDLFVQP